MEIIKRLVTVIRLKLSSEVAGRLLALSIVRILSVEFFLLEIVKPSVLLRVPSTVVGERCYETCRGV